MLKPSILTRELKRLQMTYDKNWDDTKFSFKVEEYYKHLKDLSEESFVQGVEKCIREYDRFPTIAQMLSQCRISRGSKEVKVDYVATDNHILDKMFDDMKEEEQQDIKKLAFRLMKQIGMIQPGYSKGKDRWCDSMISSSFNSAFKYIALRKYLKDECIRRGYKWLGEVKHSVAGWCSFENAFSIEIQSRK